MSPKLLFIAVPRTGSMSMIEALKPHGLHAVKYDVGSCDNTFDPQRPLTTFYHASVRSLSEARIIPENWTQDRISVAFIRNPWDRLVSLYHYLFETLGDRHKREGLLNFEDFARRVCAFGVTALGPYNCLGLSQANPQEEWIDYPRFIGRFEHIEEDWARVCEMIGVDAPLPHVGATEHDDYRTYYTPDLADAVGNHYAQDCYRGDYEF